MKICFTALPKHLKLTLPIAHYPPLLLVNLLHRYLMEDHLGYLLPCHSILAKHLFLAKFVNIIIIQPKYTDVGINHYITIQAVLKLILLGTI